MLITRLLALLFSFFSLGVDPPAGDEGAPVGDEGATAGDEGADKGKPADDDDDDLQGLVDSGAEAETPEKRAARERKEEIERVAEEAARRVQAGAPAAAAPAPSAEQQARQREDYELELLRQNGATAAQIADKQWEINTNRTLRASDQKANFAMLQAQEFNDKGEFRELAADPVQGPIYRVYKDRVEKELAELRAKGTNVPRTTLMYYLYGRDRAQGKFKTKKAAQRTEATEMPRNVTRIDRGRTPAVGARGDARGGGKSTLKQELEKRLEGKRI